MRVSGRFLFLISPEQVTWEKEKSIQKIKKISQMGDIDQSNYYYWMCWIHNNQVAALDRAKMSDDDRKCTRSILWKFHYAADGKKDETYYMSLYQSMIALLVSVEGEAERQALAEGRVPARLVIRA